MIRRFFWFSVKLLLAVVMIYWIYASGHIDVPAIKGLLQPLAFLVLVSMVFASFFLTIIRFHILSRQVVPDLSFNLSLQLTFLGAFFNFCIPGGTGGDLVKTLMLSKKTTSTNAQALGVTFIDRILGLFSLCLIAFISLTMSWNQLLLNTQLMFSYMLISTLLLIGAVLIASFYFKFTKAPKALSQNILLKKYVLLPLSFFKAQLSKRILFQALMISLVSHVILTLTFVVAASLFNLPSWGIMTYIVAVPTGLIMASLPLTPAGIGLAQVAFFTIFKIYTGEASDTPATLVTVYQILLFVVSLPGLYYYLFGNFSSLKKGENNAANII